MFLKILVIGTAATVGIVYFMIGTFLNILLSLAPIPVQTAVNPVPVAQSVQLGSYVEQARPTNLNVGLNVQ